MLLPHLSYMVQAPGRYTILAEGSFSDTSGSYTTLGYRSPDCCSADALHKYSKRQGCHGDNRAFGVNGGSWDKLLFLNLPQGTEEEFIMQMIESNTGLIEAIGNKFPPSIWSTLALTYRGWQGWAYFLLFVGLSFLLLFLLYWIGNRFFYKGYLTGQEIRRKDTAISTREMQRHITRTSSPILALLKREWKLFMHPSM